MVNNDPLSMHMKIIYFLILFLLCAQLSHAQNNMSEDDSMIRAARVKTNELIANHDLKGLARYWLKDYVRIAGNGNIQELFYWPLIKFLPSITALQ